MSKTPTSKEGIAIVPTPLSVPFRIVVKKKPTPLENEKVEGGYEIIVGARTQEDAEGFVAANKFGLVSCTRVRS